MIDEIENIKEISAKAEKFRIKKIKEVLSKINPKRHELNFVLVWCEMFGYDNIKRLCEILKNE